MEDSIESAQVGLTHLMLYTPRTPKVRERQLRFNLASTSAVQENEAGYALDELLHQTWNIFGVSALFGFHHDEVQLKLYSKKLREEIASTLTQEDVTYDAKISVIENVTPQPSSLDPTPIKVEVFSKIIAANEVTEKLIYKGIFISWKTQQVQMDDSGTSLRLPLLLCRGSHSCINAVHHTMCRMFDCMITALPASQDDLMWLVPIIITPSNKDELPKSTEEIKMEYTIPDLPITDTITVKFKVLDLVKMLEVITRDIDNDCWQTHLEVHHVQKFHEVLHQQILEAGGLQLGLCTLHRIHLPAVTIMENRMKITNMEGMNRVLLYFNDKALDTFHTLHFEM